MLTRFENGVELHQQPGAKLFAFTHRLLELQI